MKKTKPDIIGWSPGTPTDPGLFPARPPQTDSSKYFRPRIQECLRSGQLQSRNIFSTGDKKKTRIAFSLANFLTIKRSKYYFRPGKNRIQSISGLANIKVQDCLIPTWRKSCPGMFLPIKDCFRPDWLKTI
jgi:hypothetical protein